jgi:hypothetical protein
MRTITLALTVILCTILLQAAAQTEIPKGYQKGSLVLADGSVSTGYVKETIRKKATILFADNSFANKKTYTAGEIVAAEIEGTKYVGLQNDFFKVICEGEISYLQKASDAKGSIIYNGTDPIVVNGTEGKPGDYFLYHSGSRQLTLVTEKNVADVAALFFKGNINATEKSKLAKTDLLQLKEAVIAFNSSPK